MSYKIVIIVFVLLFLLIYDTSCIQTSGIAPKPDVVVLSHKLTEDEAGNAAVLVKIKNVGSVIAEMAEVRVTFYDTQKDIIDSSRDSMINLKPDETWDFTIRCNVGRYDEIRSYDVEVTSGTSAGMP